MKLNNSVTLSNKPDSEIEIDSVTPGQNPNQSSRSPVPKVEVDCKKINANQIVKSMLGSSVKLFKKTPEKLDKNKESSDTKIGKESRLGNETAEAKPCEVSSVKLFKK